LRYKTRTERGGQWEGFWGELKWLFSIIEMLAQLATLDGLSQLPASLSSTIIFSKDDLPIFDLPLGMVR
jgi:hypothetical protein